jgi:hypothetical protein
MNLRHDFSMMAENGALGPSPSFSAPLTCPGQAFSGQKWTSTFEDPIVAGLTAAICAQAAFPDLVTGLGALYMPQGGQCTGRKPEAQQILPSAIFAS